MRVRVAIAHLGAVLHLGNPVALPIFGRGSANLDSLETQTFNARLLASSNIYGGIKAKRQSYAQPKLRCGRNALTSPQKVVGCTPLGCRRNE